jgi:hypothetical protein
VDVPPRFFEGAREGSPISLDEISKKLNLVLTRKPSNGRDVVYAFVKIRKIIEKGGAVEKDTYKWLNLFCNWLLHIKLSRPPVADFIAQALDQYLIVADKRHLVNTEVYRFLSFELLRSNLRMFLSNKGFPAVWTEDDFAWNNLLRFYADEVRDTPLLISTIRLKLLRKVVLTSCEPSEAIMKANPHLKLFGLHWQLTMNNGNSVTVPYTTNIMEEPSGPSLG